MCAKRRSASCKKRREFLRESHTPLCLLIGRIIFLTCEKTSFAILIGRIIFFTCEKHSSLPWLARTHLHIKIYNTTFWWVFLIMYIIKVIVPGRYCSYPILNSCPLAFKHIQLFQERLSEKAHTTFLKGFVGGFECTVLQRKNGTWGHRHMFSSAKGKQQK